MGSKDTYSRSRSFWLLGERYLRLSRIVAEQIILNENKSFVVSWKEVTPELFEEQTKWSDLHIVEPLLFNFYHGLELVLKGFSLLRGKPGGCLDHRLTFIFKTFRERYPEASHLLPVLGRYLVMDRMPEIIREFLALNKISVDSLYESFRYPFSRKLTRKFEHFTLKYKGKRGLPFYRNLVKDIDYLIIGMVKLSRTMQNTAE